MSRYENYEIDAYDMMIEAALMRDDHTSTEREPRKGGSDDVAPQGAMTAMQYMRKNGWVS